MPINKFFVISGFLILISCSTPKPLSGSAFIFGFNFTPYTEKEFLFTLKEYEAEYGSIGLITCIIFPEKKKVTVQYQDKLYSRYYSKDVLELELIQAEEILQIIYEKCIEMGAITFVNFKFNTIDLSIKEFFNWKHTFTSLKEKTIIHFFQLIFVIISQSVIALSYCRDSCNFL